MIQNTRYLKYKPTILGFKYKFEFSLNYNCNCYCKEINKEVAWLILQQVFITLLKFLHTMASIETSFMYMFVDHITKMTASAELN